jgi:hypothetical protein
VGCEYAGTTTLAMAICKWVEETMGETIGFHDHFKIPGSFGHLSADSDSGYWEDDELDSLLGMSVRLKEKFQRYLLDYHLQPAFYAEPHHMMIGLHIDEAIYPLLYYGYGKEGDYGGDREKAARLTERTILERAPDTVLVLVKASPEVIARRMRENPHRFGLVQEKDIERVLARFEEEYNKSLIRNKFALDTSAATIDETLAEFAREMKPHLTEAR